MSIYLKGLFYGIVLTCVIVSSAMSDTIYFKNGTRLDIERSWEDDGKIKCIMYGNEFEYQKGEIDKIERNGVIIILETDAVPEKERPHVLTKPIDDQSSQHHKEALVFAESGLWAEAIDKEKQAYELRPNDKSIQEALSFYFTKHAHQLYQKGQFESALSKCHEALKYTPEYPPAKEGISNIYIVYAQNSYDQRDFDSAEMHLENASDYYTDNPKAYILSGKIACDKDKYDEAKQEWLKALDLDPNLDEAKILLQKFSQEHHVEESYDKQKLGNFSVKYEGTGKTEKAQIALQILNEAYLEIGSELGEYPQYEIQVIIYPKRDVENLDYYPDFAAGLYDGKIRFTEDLFNDQSYLKAVLYHEYTHVIVHIIGGRNVPIWLNEGLAEYTASKFIPASYISYREKLLKSAAKNDVIIPFNQLNIASLSGLKELSYPMIALLYAQSDSFVTYVIDKFTIYDVRTILESISNGDNAQTAIIDTFNYSLKDLEDEWKGTLLE